jgi:TonB-linked SusC/RagA family outer membrane protein
MLKRILSTLILLAFLVPVPASAQTGTIGGIVTGAESGNALPGVNVVVTELDRGAATDTEGRYTIENIPPGTYTLRISFVGYQTVETEVTVEANQTLEQNFQLQPGAVGLDEVVVTGYGQQQTAGEITGSIANVSSGELQDVPIQSAEGMIQGRAPGVTVSTTSGNPGGGFEVDIRGEGSINAGNRPLYVVDGVPISFAGQTEGNDTSPLNSIPARDIESIQVLKDAAAASIYGAQAANGVVLITTKSGQQGDTRVSVSYEGGVRMPLKYFDLMNRDEWFEFQTDAFGEDVVRQSIITNFGYEPDTPVEEMRDFNWGNFVRRRGAVHKANFSANGGTESTQFYLSGGWERTQAAIKEVKYEQFQFRANLTQQFTPNLDVDLNLNLSRNDMPGVCQDGFFINCPFYQPAEEPPIAHPYLDDGTYNPNTEEGLNNNLAVVLYEENRDSDVTNIVGNLSPTYNFTPWLSLSGSFGLDWKRTEELDQENPIADPSSGGSTHRSFYQTTNFTGNLRLNFEKTFGQVHNLSTLVGSEYRREFQDETEVSVQGFNNNLLTALSAGSSINFWQGFDTEYRIWSYFGQLNYDYDGRYILTLSSRYDGSSRFGEAEQWGFFPSASVAWRISEESFFNVGFVDDLKLRTSYGVTGNSEIGNFSARGLYNVSGSYRDQVGFLPTQLENRRLSWEEKRTLNLGLDWALWQGRFSGTVEVYRERSTELLLGRPLPRSSGFGSITENVGEVENRGIEVSLETTNLQDLAGFTWRSRFNVGINQNEVLELTGDQEQLGSGVLPTAEGHSQEAWHVIRWAGVNSADGRPMYYDKDGNLTFDPSQEDRVWFDGGEEDASGGFGNTLQYKGLSLDVFFQFSYGATALPNTQRTWSLPFGENALRMFHTDRWREPGDVAEWPRATPFGNFDNADGYTGIRTQWLYDASYIRLKNITLSYNLPSDLAESIGLRGVRVYATGLNLRTWTSYLGVDPEVAGALQSSSYPSEKQFDVGVEMNL